MDYRCPVCGEDLGKKKLARSIIARMQIDCSKCKSTIRVNVHRAEVMIVSLNFATVVVLAALAYGYRSQGLTLSAFAAAMVGALALPLLERTYLRAWPRYVSGARSPEHGTPHY